MDAVTYSNDIIRIELIFQFVTHSQKTLMSDGATAHILRENVLANHGIAVLPWPSESPYPHLTCGMRWRGG